MDAQLWEVIFSQRRFCCSRWWIFGGICVDLCFELGKVLLQ